MKHLLSIHVGIASALLLLSLFLYNAWYVEVKNTSANAVALQEEVTKKETETGRAVAARDALGMFTAEGSSTNSHFVTEKEVVPFLEEVQKLGESVGASVTVVSVAADADETDPSIRLSLSVVGTFDAVVRALGLIEHSSYAMRTEMFDLKTVETTPGAWTANTVLLVSTPLQASSTTP